MEENIEGRECFWVYGHWDYRFQPDRVFLQEIDALRFLNTTGYGEVHLVYDGQDIYEAIKANKATFAQVEEEEQ